MCFKGLCTAHRRVGMVDSGARQRTGLTTVANPGNLRGHVASPRTAIQSQCGRGDSDPVCWPSALSFMGGCGLFCMRCVASHMARDRLVLLSDGATGTALCLNALRCCQRHQSQQRQYFDRPSHERLRLARCAVRIQLSADVDVYVYSAPVGGRRRALSAGLSGSLAEPIHRHDTPPIIACSQCLPSNVPIVSADRSTSSRQRTLTSILSGSERGT